MAKKWFKRRRTKTPTVLQMEAVECGAAALAIVMEYYGKVVPLEQVRLACGVSRSGSIARNMVLAAREFGFEARGFKRSPRLVQEGLWPVIVHWNFNHFLVVEGFEGGRVYINDPATGPRIISYEDFDQSFTGVVLEIKPGDNFQRSGKRPSLIQLLRPQLAGSGTAVFYLLVASLFLTMVGVVVPAFSRVFVDQYLVAGLKNWLRPLFIGMGIAILLLPGLTAILQYYLLRLETRLSIATSSQFFWHILRLPLS